MSGNLEETKRPISRLSSGVVLAIVALSLIAGAGLFAQAASGVQLNNVQVFVQTSSSSNYEYDLSVYNSSGSLVAYSQTGYPGAGFELPAGTYLITASAYSYPYYYCYECPVYAGQAAYPNLGYQTPQYEYGWAFEQVSSPASVTIATQNDSSIPTTSVTVQASFFNGTAVSGAYVSAYVVGEDYYYNPNLSLYGQTNAQGVATLTVPQAPVDVSAYESVPVNLPHNETTVTTTIGGQKVNVTVYWSPMYVELTGTALIVPPATSATMTLVYQQGYYCCYPLAYNQVAGISQSPSGAPGTQGSFGQQPGSSPQGPSTPAQKIGPIPSSVILSGGESGGQSLGSIGGSGLWVAIVAVLVATGSVSAALILRRRRD